MENTFQPVAQKRPSFLQRNWFIILLAFIATIIVLAKIFLTKPQEEVVGPPPPSAPSWNEVTPGTTTSEEVKQKLGEPETAVPEGDYLKFLYPRQGGGPKHEVILEGTTVALIKDRVLDGNISAFRQKYGLPENEFWGEHKTVGFKTYVWPKNGIAVVAGAEEGIIYEVWYFQPMTMDQFLASWGKGLSVEFVPEGY